MADWITVEEAAELSGYNPEYVRRLIRGNVIEAAKKGRDWWVDRASLLAYLKASHSSDDKRRGPKAGS